MVRVVRIRERSFTITGKRSAWSNVDDHNAPATTVTYNSESHSSRCTDRVGSPVTDGPFTSTQRKGAMSFNGMVRTLGGQKYVFETYPAHSQIPATQQLSAPNGWQLDLVAGTNPSRPVINPVEMAQNLVQLPKLLRDTFRFLSNPKKALSTTKSVANNYLAFQFGWKPFIEDLTKLLDVQSYIIKRNKELNQLYSGKGLKRRLRFGSDTNAVQTSQPLSFVTPAQIVFPVTVTTVRESWGTIRWYPTAPPKYHPDDARWNQHIRNIVLGMTPEGIANGVWKIIPWTWLIGWFTNVGKYTLLNSNTVPARFSHTCFMSKVTVTRELGAPKLTGIASSSLTVSGSATYENRNRITGNVLVLPGLNLPYLDGFRLSVLGALTAQRLKR